MNDELNETVTEKSTWIRGLYMLLFAVIYSIAELMVILVALFQFIATLFTGKPMERVLDFGDDLSIYVYEILQYVTFNSDEKPFPYGPWPTEGNRPVVDYPTSDDEADETDKTSNETDSVQGEQSVSQPASQSVPQGGPSSSQEAQNNVTTIRPDDGDDGDTPRQAQ